MKSSYFWRLIELEEEIHGEELRMKYVAAKNSVGMHSCTFTDSSDSSIPICSEEEPCVKIGSFWNLKYFLQAKYKLVESEAEKVITEFVSLNYIKIAKCAHRNITFCN